MFRIHRLLIAAALMAVAPLPPAATTPGPNDAPASQTQLATTVRIPIASGGGQEVKISEDNRDNASTWRFRPPELQVTAGTTVTWRNPAPNTQTHTVTADNGTFDSGNIAPTNIWRRFDTPGTYSYHCTPHPWMKAVIRVIRR